VDPIADLLTQRNVDGSWASKVVGYQLSSGYLVCTD
jgi:hypothetical protein